MNALLMDAGLMDMPPQKPKPWATLRVKAAFARKIADLSEAWGPKRWPKWKVLEHLVGDDLDDELNAVQAKLKEIRKSRARTEALQAGPDEPAGQ